MNLLSWQSVLNILLKSYFAFLIVYKLYYIILLLLIILPNFLWKFESLLVIFKHISVDSSSTYPNLWSIRTREIRTLTVGQRLEVELKWQKKTKKKLIGVLPTHVWRRNGLYCNGHNHHKTACRRWDCSPRGKEKNWAESHQQIAQIFIYLSKMFA